MTMHAVDIYAIYAISIFRIKKAIRGYRLFLLATVIGRIRSLL